MSEPSTLVKEFDMYVETWRFFGVHFLHETSWGSLLSWVLSELLTVILALLHDSCCNTCVFLKTFTVVATAPKTPKTSTSFGKVCREGHQELGRLPAPSCWEVGLADDGVDAS
jgi:hypothetical protein